MPWKEKLQEVPSSPESLSSTELDYFFPLGLVGMSFTCPLLPVLFLPPHSPFLQFFFYIFIFLYMCLVLLLFYTIFFFLFFAASPYLTFFPSSLFYFPQFPPAAYLTCVSLACIVLTWLLSSRITCLSDLPASHLPHASYLPHYCSGYCGDNDFFRYT